MYRLSAPLLSVRSTLLAGPVAIALLLVACGGQPAPAPSTTEATTSTLISTASSTPVAEPTALPTIALADIPLGDDVVDRSGASLIDLPLGLTEVRGTDAPDPSAVLVVMHGFASEGYEWVYPLHRYVADGYRTYFYRWDWNTCPLPAADALHNALEQLLLSEPAPSRIIVVSHSYGGVVGAALSGTWTEATPLAMHVVAAPLADQPACDPAPAFAPSETVSLTQWRTRHELDGAFQNLPVDPQVVDLPGTEVVLLPAEYNGDRLGHNRSLSWVADQLTSQDSRN